MSRPTPTSSLDLTGAQYGRLEVLGPAPAMRSARGVPHTQWECRCVCGQTLRVRHDQLVRPVTPVRSCGCAEGRIPNQTLSLARCAQAQGLARQTVASRLAAGWTLADALLTPRGQSRCHHREETP